jgi:hypothetical protein
VARTSWSRSPYAGAKPRERLRDQPSPTGWRLRSHGRGQYFRCRRHQLLDRGYFEETKLAHICVGDLAEAQLLGYPQPILGRVDTITRGMRVSDATPSTQGLPSADPVYAWVRLAQRVPVHIAITDAPPGVPLVSGLTATVSIRKAEAQEKGNRLFRRLHAVVERVRDILHRPQPRPSCIPAAHTDTDRSGPAEQQWKDNQLGVFNSAQRHSKASQRLYLPRTPSGLSPRHPPALSVRMDGRLASHVLKWTSTYADGQTASILTGFMAVF